MHTSVGSGVDKVEAALKATESPPKAGDEALSKFTGKVSMEELMMKFAQTDVDKPCAAPIGTCANPGAVPKSRGAERFFNYVGEWNVGHLHGKGRYAVSQRELWS